MNPERPPWLKVRVRGSDDYRYVEELLHSLHLNTVCREANCPNRMECFNKKTATFLILGSVCTRNCTFCNVTKGETEEIDPTEPDHIVDAVQKLDLRYVVITSVTRDDLPDGGSGHFSDVVSGIKRYDRAVKVEVLIPDFLGKKGALKTVIDSGPDVINHNVETVPGLYPQVRPQADYERSLDLLRSVKQITGDRTTTKSGLMLGLGESEKEVITTLEDLREVSCDLITIGQYLAPSKNHFPVAEYIHPDRFEKFRGLALEMGFSGVASAPFVRSSYAAAELAQDAR